jgi:hypothetical protein
LKRHGLVWLFTFEQGDGATQTVLIAEVVELIDQKVLRW